MDDIEILKTAVKNALEHGGRADAGAVFSKVVGSDKSMLKDIKTARALVDRLTSEVNAKTPEDIAEMADELGVQLKTERKETEPELKPLPNVVSGVVLRLPPEPSGYMHLGHAISFMINYLYREKYGGKLWLRFEDTNPKLIKKRDEYVESFESGLKWLGIEWDEKKFVSSDIEKIYSYGKTLIDESKAYVCLCTPEAIKTKRLSGDSCEHRDQSTQRNVELWDAAKAGSFNDGEAVVRFKADMKSSDFALRDPSIFRIIKNDYKPYSLWPLYDLASVAEDHLCGITHVLRSNEFKVGLQERLRAALGFKSPEIVQYGRYNFRGTPFSKRLIRALIKDGKIADWNDIRLPTVSALIRRGIQPKAIRDFVLTVGYSGSKHEYTWDLLLTLNRRIIDENARRLFFVSNPVELTVENAKPLEVRLKYHPSKDLGSRIVKTDGHFFIDHKDYDNIKLDQEIRLKDLYTVRIEDKSDGRLRGKFVSDSIIGDETIIQWATSASVPVRVVVLGELLKGDGTFNENSLGEISGLGEPAVGTLKKGDIIQFERFGFCILDNKADNSFVYISR